MSDSYTATTEGSTDNDDSIVSSVGSVHGHFLCHSTKPGNEFPFKDDGKENKTAENDTKVPEWCTLCATVQAHDQEKCTTWQEMAAIEESGKWASQQAMEAWQARMQEAVDQMEANHEEKGNVEVCVASIDNRDFQQARC